LTPSKRLVAYFTMEIALENAMPSYSGGLGVLAGDTIRAAADIRLPMLAAAGHTHLQNPRNVRLHGR